MRFVIHYSKLLDRARFFGVPKANRIRIHRAITEKLAVYPELFGKPLRLSLKGCWSHRVGDYRIIYRIEGKRVEIMLFGHRSTIYDEAEKML